MLKVCKYFPCVTAKRTGRNCADSENCQSYKYYERYGEEPLYIGSCCNPKIFSGLEENLKGNVTTNE